MHILIMLAFLVFWLLVLWAGSLALEATGLDRPRSRFQALSALTGTGFTTSQAELIVEHSKRRRIVTYLIFLGNTAVLGFIVLLVIYIISGLEAPSPAVIVLTVAIVVFIALSFWLGLIDRISNGLLKAGKASRNSPVLVLDQVIPVSQDRALARIKVAIIAENGSISLEEAGLTGGEVMVLLVEHEKEMIRDPAPGYRLEPEDILICYGSTGAITKVV